MLIMSPLIRWRNRADVSCDRNVFLQFTESIYSSSEDCLIPRHHVLPSSGSTAVSSSSFCLFPSPLFNARTNKANLVQSFEDLAFPGSFWTPAEPKYHPSQPFELKSGM